MRLLLLLALAGCEDPPQVGRIKRVDPPPQPPGPIDFKVELEQTPAGYHGFTQCTYDTSWKLDRETGRIQHHISGTGQWRFCVVLFGKLAHELDRHEFTVTTLPPADRTPQALTALADPFVSSLAALGKKAQHKTAKRVPKKCPKSLAGDITFADIESIELLDTGAEPKLMPLAILAPLPTAYLAPKEGATRPLDPNHAGEIRRLVDMPYAGIVRVESARMPAFIEGTHQFVGGAVSGTLFVGDVRQRRLLCQTKFAFRTEREIHRIFQADPEEQNGAAPSSSLAENELRTHFSGQARRALEKATRKLSPALEPTFRL